MTSKTDYLENKLTDVLFRAQSFAIGAATLSWSVAPTIYVGFFTITPSDSAAGTESVGGSYARQPILCSLTSMAGTQAAASTIASSGTGGTTSNNAALTFTNMPASTLVAFGIFDALTAGNLLEYALLNGQPIAIAGGATVTFAAGQLTVQEDN